MGIIKQQTIKGSFFSYIGVFIGFVTNTFILTRVLSVDQVGLISILTSFALLFAQFAILGFNATARYFPHFRNEKNKHNGYLFLASTVSFVGFLLFLIGVFCFKEFIISQKSQDSTLFKEYFWYLIPLTFVTLYFNVFDLYSRLLYDAAAGRLIREFLLKLLVLVCVLALMYHILDYKQFMVAWLLANAVPMILMAIRLMRKRQFSLKPNLNFLTKHVSQNLVSLSLFGILTGAAPLLIENIDKFMINRFYGLSETGIYSIAVPFGIIIALPARSLYGIAYTVIAEAWHRNDMGNIRTVYQKSCINQLIFALLLFILVWANIDNIFKLLPAAYESGKYVIFFIGISSLIDAATGVNAVILATSKYYRYDSLFYMALVGITIISNLIFIPIYGITGAALATAITFLIFNTSRFLFLYIKFGLQPFSIKTIMSLGVGTAVYAFTLLIPQQDNLYLDGILRGGVITVLYLSLSYVLNLSTDINTIIKGLFSGSNR